MLAHKSKIKSLKKEKQFIYTKKDPLKHLHKIKRDYSKLEEKKDNDLFRYLYFDRLF